MIERHRRGPLVIASVAVVAGLVLAGLLLLARMVGDSEGGSQYLMSGAASSTTKPVASTVAPSSSAAATSLRPNSVVGIGNNPLTSAVSLRKQACVLPPWAEDDATVRTFLDVAMGCLNSTWQPVLARLSIPFTAPELKVSATVASLGCGRPPEENSFYCDGTIYLAPSSYQGTNAGRNAIPTAAISMLAHEYGHHLQQLSGTLGAATEMITLMGRETPDGLEVSRRTELQAQCLSGIFVGTNFDIASIQVAQRDNYTRGDAPGRPADHGSPRNFGEWFTKGAGRTSLDSCNTWSAASATVR